MMVQSPSLNVAQAPSPTRRTSPSKHFAGLDAIRFLLASFVIFEHFVSGDKFLPLILPKDSNHVHQLLRVLLNNLFPGEGAVIAFFVISGFCIHLPYARGRVIEPKQYFLRREVRILIPVAGAFALGFLLHSFTWTKVLWSLVCEEIYYAIYPAMLMWIKKAGWKPLFAAALIADVVVTVVTPRNPEFFAPGYALTWVLGLPIWLLGAFLAQQMVDKGVKPLASWQIWLTRLSVWAVAWVTNFSKFHMGVEFRYSLPIFGFAVFLWLRAELNYYGDGRKPWQWLENLGHGSYSVYLVHMLAPAIALAITGSAVGSPTYWTYTFASLPILCSLFYFAVERPSHQLAQQIGKRLSRPILKEPGPAIA